MKHHIGIQPIKNKVPTTDISVELLLHHWYPRQVAIVLVPELEHIRH